MAQTMSGDSNGNLFDTIRDNGVENCEEGMKIIFEAFDKDKDGCLSMSEFGAMTRLLFCNEKGKPYMLGAQKLCEIFYVFDKDQDSMLDLDEFRYCWNSWIKKILFPVTALLIIDVQNDFISGTLAIHNCPSHHDGNEVVPAINHLIDTVAFDAHFYSFDWHPEDHVSFIENVRKRKLDATSPIKTEDAKVYDTVIFEGPPLNVQKLWPAHCIQNSWGSKLHPELKVVDDAILIYKGTNPDIDSYSAFWDNNKLSQTNMFQELRSRNVTELFICGIAYDVCVASTARHALEHGFRTTLIDDACRGVDLEDIHDRKQFLINNHAVIVNSSQVKAMVQARDRRTELGYKAAMALANEEKKSKECKGK